MPASQLPQSESTSDESPGAGESANATPAMPPNWVPPPTPASQRDSGATEETVHSIGRYRVERRLGQGGFGAVYLALDEELNRRVAIKVPKRMAAAQVAEYREEAQKLAKLEHPGVVPIFDIGHTDQFPVFLVTKYLEGGTLSDWVQNSLPDFMTVAKLIADVAEALHATHLKGIFHRDIKPANILVDAQGKPVLADFGLALKEGHGLDSASEILGTPAYMSPEQAAGEGHRVDGQTDIFSLGVVLYELLAGVRPFRASEKLPPREQTSQLLEFVKTHDPRPPRQVNDDVPRELERICLKALAKRKPERYTTARDMAEDLRHFAMNPAAQEAASVRVQLPAARDSSTPPQTPTPGTALRAGLLTPTQPISDRDPLKIVPKGLRSFDAGDASFFLDLLPGPRDRDGLPESIRFWKTRIETHDPEVLFASGVLYGPSGCGKSSLVKAGLIPHLSGDIVPIYLEATGDDTEPRLSRAIRRACPAFGEDLSLTLLLKNLRRGVGLPSGKKALIVLDQFEQWLHAKRGQTNQELPAALRQCDGERVQCLILVRDDFWLAISRFLEELETPLVQGRNCAMADLFDPPHARKVLDAFGVAFGKVGWDSVPTHPATGHRNTSHAGRDGVPTYNSFLDQSIAALSEEGKIISVRLALFAEMVKSKPWTPETLNAIGGVEGVGVTFLDETFSASNAPMAYRTHQVAVRGVLKALLPEVGTDIKGHRVSRDELLPASGYAQRPRDFDGLLHILDRDLRLITPVDAEDSGERGGVSPPVDSSVDPNRGADAAPLAKARAHYQLAHDYLVPSIRAWVTKKQKETWRGRAALRLEDRSAQWQRTRERRHIPSLFEYTSIVCGVPSRTQTAEQRRMMRTATRHHVLRWGSLLVLLLATVFGIERHLAERQRIADDQTATTRINDLAQSPATGVSIYIETLEPLRPLAIPKLRSLVADSQAKPVYRLHAAYALAAFGDTSMTPTLIDTILDNVATVDGSEAKNMVIAFRDLSRLGLRPDRSGRSPNLQNALHDITRKITDRIQSLPVQSTAESEGLPVRLRFAALALYLGDASVLSPLVQLGPDPTERTALTLRLKNWPPDDLSAVREILATTSDEPLRSVLCAALGKFPKPVDSDHDALVAVLKERFVNASDGGTHSAIDWTLRQWGVELPDLKFEISNLKSQSSNLKSADKTAEPRRWSVNSAGMTLVEIPAGSYVIGDEPTPEQQAPQTFEPVSVKSQYEPQLAAWDATLEAQPEDAPALLSRGVVHFYLGHDEQSIADLSKVIEKEPTNFYAVQIRAVANARQKHAEAARADLKQFETLVKVDTSQKAYLRVLVATFLGDRQTELAALEQQLAEHAADPNWLYDGACVFAILGAHATDDAVALKHRDRAMKLLQSAVQHGHTNFGHTASNPDLESLHGRTDFRALLQPKATKPAGRPRVELTRTMFLSNREVSVAQFLAFVNDPNTPADQKPEKWEGHQKQFGPTDDCPVQQTNWFDAVLYCNWLSRKEGCSPCYQTTGKKLKLMNYDNTEYEAEDWQLQVEANGYRLPTEAEWEAACRARTTTGWSCGEDEVELPEFAVFFRQRTLPGGTKLPNGWGLFDAHGNVLEWCHDWYGEAISGGSDPRGPAAGQGRLLRGGSFDLPPQVVRSAYRNVIRPTNRDYYSGFRLARTKD